MNITTMGTVKKIKINEGVENQLEDGVIVCVFAALQRFWNNWVSMNETFECFFLRSQDTNYTEKIFFFFVCKIPKSLVKSQKRLNLVLFLIKPLPNQFGEHP